MKTMISLVGGRPLPNILAALHLKPDRCCYVVSRDSIGEGRDFQKTIEALPSNLKPSDQQIIDVPPYTLSDTINACRKFAARYPDDDLIFNVTLGPKTMAFGAYDVAKELSQKGKQVEICYLGYDGLIWVYPVKNKEPVTIGIKQYFTSYGWDVSWKTEPQSDKFRDLSVFLAEQLPLAHDVVHFLRGNDKGKGKRTIHSKTPILAMEFQFLEELQAYQVVKNVSQTATQISWMFENEDDANFLLKGDWLEYYTYYCAKQLNEKNHSTYYECGWGVEDKNGKGEIDFCGVVGGQLVIASCKTEPSIKRTWFEELDSKAEQLGKGMCSTFLISTVSRDSRSNKDLEDYTRWSVDRQIILVMREDIPQLPEILRKIAKNDPQLEPKAIPSYPRI